MITYIIVRGMLRRSEELKAVGGVWKVQMGTTETQTILWVNFKEHTVRSEIDLRK